MSAAYGSINASCGDEGLFSSLDEFGSFDRSKTGEFEEVAPVSLRTMWLGSDIVNYESRVRPTLLRAEMESTSHVGINFERETRIVVKYESTGSLSYLLEALPEHEPVKLEDIRFVFNSSSVFFIHTRQGFFYSLGIKRSDDDLPVFGWSRTYKGRSGRVVSAHLIGGKGTLIETDRRILLFQNNEWKRVLDAEVISIRTFPRSKRFRHVACLTRSDGLLLVAAYDDRALNRGMANSRPWGQR